MAVIELGKAGLAVVVLGAACSTDDQSLAETTSSTQLPTSTSTSRSITSTTTTPTNGTDFKRVNLDFVSAYILYRAGEAVLVDTGVAGSTGSIALALTEINLGWNAVGQVILTHKHPDHIGSVAEVIGQAGGASVFVGAADIPAIDVAVPVTAVGDGDRVFDLDIIESPGHTAGHISVLDSISGILVAGDALNGQDGGVVGANPSFSEDMGAADSTVSKLAEFDYEVALFGHGEPLLDGASAAVGELAASL